MRPSSLTKNEEIFQNYDDVELIEYADSKYEKNILRYEKNGKYGSEEK